MPFLIPGYRPPEVLLRYPNQSTAVDIWAIGIIMISILSSSHPFFNATSDLATLSQMSTIFGDDVISQTASLLSRRVCISHKTQPLHLKRLCISLRNRSDDSEKTTSVKDKNKRPARICDNCQQELMACLCANSVLNMNISDIYPDSAYNLLTKLLTINPKHRISAADALEHPFFKNKF